MCHINCNKLDKLKANYKNVSHDLPSQTGEFNHIPQLRIIKIWVVAGDFHCIKKKKKNWENLYRVLFSLLIKGNSPGEWVSLQSHIFLFLPFTLFIYWCYQHSSLFARCFSGFHFKLNIMCNILAMSSSALSS